MSVTGMRLTRDQEKLVRGSTVVKRIVPVLAARHRRVSSDDLTSVGHEALVRAAIHFRADLGVPFDGYAYRFVYLDIRRWILDEAKMRKRTLSVATSDALDQMARAKDPADVFKDTIDDARAQARAFTADAFTAFTLRVLAARSAAEANDDASPEEQVDRNRRRQRLLQAIDGLGDRGRVLVLRYFEEKEWDEVAAAMGSSNATVRREHDAAVRLLSARLMERRAPRAA